MFEKEAILRNTNRGYDIFTHYLGKDVQRNMFANPFRKDIAPSCRLYYIKNNDIWIIKDFGDSSWCGDPFTFASKVLNIDSQTNFRELLSAIDNDLGLYIMEEAPADYHPIQKVAPKPVENDPLDFKAVYQSFKISELKYWSKYGITPAILDKYEVKSIRWCKFYPKDNKPYIYSSCYLEPQYGYTFNDGTGIKVYRPFSSPRFLYGGKLPKPYMFGYNQLPSTGKVVILTGGEKDVMSLASHGFDAIALNSESAKVTDELMKDLSSRFEYIVFMYDSDTTGIKESSKRVEEFSKKYPVCQLILPLSGTKKEKDISDFFRLGRTSEELSKMIQNTINN